MAGALCAEEAFRCLQHGVRARSDRLVDKQDSIDGRISHGGPSIPFLSAHRGVDQLRQMHAPLDRNVVLEAYLRGDAQSQALSELGTQESRCAVQARLDTLQGFRVCRSREEYFRIVEIVCDRDSTE